MAKKKTQIITVLFLAVLFIATLAFASYTPKGYAESEDKNTSTWYFDQLDANAKKIYNAFSKMDKDGSFIKGNGSIDLIEKGILTETEIEGFLAGDVTFRVAFQNARDAFEKDHYQIFYVDFTKVTLRVGKVADKPAAYINAGTNTDFYAKGFSGEEQVKQAIKAAEDSKNEIVKIIKDKNLNTVVSVDKIVESAHDLIIERLEYSYPAEDKLHVTGVYAIAGGGYANCVGYSTIMKWVLDDLGIENILVAGVAINSKNVTENHMWNYVKIDNLWFAVDVTWDDPINAAKATETRKTYLLLGSGEFFVNHTELGVFSPNGMTFTYPSLSDISYKFYVQARLDDVSTDLKIYTEKMLDYGAERVEHTLFTIIYKNKSLSQLKAEGLYLAARFAYASENKKVGEDDNLTGTYELEPFEQWVPLDAYLDRDTTNIQMSISRKGSIQFCITKIDSNTPAYPIDLSLEGNHEVLSKPVQMPYFSSYKAQPFIRKSEPSLGRCILPEKQHYVVEYDDEFKKIDESLDIGIEVEATENVTGKVTNLTYRKSEFVMPNGRVRNSTIVEFDFEPEDVYQNYLNTYNLKLTNVVGKESGKVPNKIPICVTFQSSIPCPTYVAMGAISNEAFVIALPILVVNENLDIFDYDGNTEAANPMDIRLVASKPSQNVQDDLLEKSGEEEILSSDVYDISLTCKDHLARLKTDADYNVTIGLPYPKGYNYKDNQDVTFKAYHYKKQPDGTYIAEELICRIGEKGLEVLVNDFSPFAVVAVPKTEENKAANKFISVEAKSSGGDIETQIDAKDGTKKSISAVGLHSLNSGSKEFTIKAKDNFIIDKILLNGQKLKVANKTVTFEYDKMQDDNILEVFFIASIVKDEEIKNGFDEIIPVAPPIIKKQTIEINGLKFENKQITYDKNINSYMLELIGLPSSGYKVIYKNNTLDKAGITNASVTIYKLKENGEIDENYNPLRLTATLSVIEPTIENDQSKDYTALIVSLAVGVVIITLAVVVLFIKKKKN